MLTNQQMHATGGRAKRLQRSALLFSPSHEESLLDVELRSKDVLYRSVENCTEIYNMSIRIIFCLFTFQRLSEL
jgi:hypothetical protein